MGSPYTGDYRNASVVHDIACIGANKKQRKAADRMYYHACRRGGCTKWQALVQYLGVRIGAWLPGVTLWTAATKSAKTASQRYQQVAAVNSIVGTFYELAAMLEPRSDELEIAEVELLVEEYLAKRVRQLS